MRVDGSNPGDKAGTSVATGDFDGDGQTDLLIGAPGADNRGRGGAGSVYLVLGGTTGHLSLRERSEGVRRIDGEFPGGQLGSSVANAGDVNGDGISDLLLGAPRSPGSIEEGAGSAYLVFGREQFGDIDLTIATGVVRIAAEAYARHFGWSAAGLGDVNADSFDDFAIGAPFSSYNDRPSSGSVFVYFGNQTQVLTSNALGMYISGLRIDGAEPWDAAGWSLSAAWGKAEPSGGLA
ncbi:MAG: integrin alpha, partial [Candidatus Binatia bacterium]